MYINKYEKIGAPVVVLLAPMMVSGSDLYELMGTHFTGEYCIIAPDQGGHGKSGAYISADEEYRFLKEFFQREGIEDIHLVYGASLGVAVAYRLFLDPDFNVAHAWFDGVALAGCWICGMVYEETLQKQEEKTGENSCGSFGKPCEDVWIRFR